MDKNKMLFSEFEASEKNDWLEKVRKAASEEELKSLFTETGDGFTLSAYYDYSDLERIDFKDSLPGNYPFVNGFTLGQSPKLRVPIRIQKFMKASQLMQEAVQSGADELFISGDHFGNENELDILLKAIDPSKTALHVDFGESNTAFAFIWADEMAKRGIPASEIKGSISYDFLGDLAFKGNYDYSLSESVNILKSMIEFGQTALPHVKMLQVNAAKFHNAGASAGMELGFLFAQLTEYVDLLTEKGFSAEQLAKQVQVHLAVSADDYFMSIAKLRAFRVLWANWAEAYGIENVFPQVHAVSSQRNKTSFDEYNNLLRLTAEGMAAFIGQCDAVSLWAHDDSFRLANSFSTRIASNIYHLLKYESKLNQTQDAAAGSYYIENLTDKLVDTAWTWFTECEKKGGFSEALKSKYIQGIIEQRATKEQKTFTDGKKVLVGANKYPDKNEQLAPKTEKAPSRAELKDELNVMPLREQRLAENLENAKLKMESSSLEKEMEDAGNEEE